MRMSAGWWAGGVAMCIAVLGLLGLSYRSVEQGRRSSQMLAEQRAEVMLALLAAALHNDMKGAQVSVLLPLELHDVVEEPPYDLRDTFARAFARFPYAESFFVWKVGTNGTSLRAQASSPARGARHAGAPAARLMRGGVEEILPTSQGALPGYQGARPIGSFDLFNRADRTPVWDAPPSRPGTYPAVLRRNPETSGPLLDALFDRLTAGRRFTVFTLVLNDTPYQVVAKLLPGTRTRTPEAVVGFTVNLAWIRERYFSELAWQVSGIGDAVGVISLAIEDDAGHTVVATRPLASDGPVRQRAFQPLFFDPAMLSTLAPGTTACCPWTARVGPAQGPVIEGGTAARATYAMLSAAALASVVAMLLTARAVRARAELAAMQSDFVCTVTHELKTPLAFIRLLGETLGHRRYNSLETIADYARLLSQEAWRLTRLIDNILTFARVTNSGRQQQFEAIEVAEIVEDVLNQFRPQLAAKAFDVTVEMPADLPRVCGDRAMLCQVLDNLVDNAIKYSSERRVLQVSARMVGERMQLEVTDQGRGIVAEEIPRVFDKFYRGRAGSTGGSGLGLSIVKRIMEEHRGDVELSSVRGEGTTVRLLLPVLS